MNIFKHKKDTAYVSPIDRFQAEFDRTHPLTASQQAEVNKYRVVDQLRDVALAAARNAEDDNTSAG